MCIRDSYLTVKGIHNERNSALTLIFGDIFAGAGGSFFDHPKGIFLGSFQPLTRFSIAKISS